MSNFEQSSTGAAVDTQWALLTGGGLVVGNDLSGLSGDNMQAIDPRAVAATAPLGVNGGEVVSLSGSSTTLDVAGTLDIGAGGISALLIDAGAVVIVGGDLDIGNVAGGLGIVDIENGTLAVAGSLLMGFGGSGTLIVGPNAQVSFGNGLLLGPGAELVQYAPIDPPVLNGGANTINTSTEQDYSAYVTGAASFVINQGVSFTLATPKITGGAVAFQIGSTTSNTQATTLVLNAGAVAAGTQINFKNAAATLVIGTETLGTIDIRSTDTAAATLVANPNLYVPLIGNFGGTLASWRPGDVIKVDTTVAATFRRDPNNAAVVDVVESANIGHVLGTLAFTAASSASLALSTTSYLQDVLVSPLCFAAGVQIATPVGEVPVEQLAEGDKVTTLGGQAREIVWVGEGQVLATRGQRSAATPVIVRKGALADNVPNRDLRITKAHGLFIDGVLIPVEYLVNHRSILWDDRAQEVRIFHVELETHDVLLANGAPTESYRDDGNRWLFQNANSGWHLSPQASCAEVHTGGPIVDAAWARLLERSGPRLTPPLTTDPDLHLLVDRQRLDPVSWAGDVALFIARHSPADVRIMSRAAAPQELGLARDPRCLGVALRQIAVRQENRFRVIEANDAALTTGFYAYEADNGFRWTSGEAVLPPDLFAGHTGPLQIMLTVASTANYLDEGVRQNVA